MTADAADAPRETGSERYSAGAILLHWLTAAAILLQFVLAWRMDGPKSPETFAVVQLHKSVGITILLLTLVRLGWRLAHRPAPMPTSLAAWERGLAKLTHVGFYVILVAMPLTGWLMVSASELRIPTLLYGVIPWPDIPGLAGLPHDARKVWREIGHDGHGVLALGMLALMALHVAGALKHQLFSRDEPVLARMAPGARPGRWLEPRLLAILAGAVAVIAVGVVVRPPSPGVATPRNAGHEHEHEDDAADDLAHEEQASPPVSAPATQVQAPAAAQPAATNVAAFDTSEPVRWTVSPGGTVGFATSWGGQAIEGRFERWEADIRFSPQALDRSRVKVEIDLASAGTGDAQRDASLLGEEWLDAGAHPRARFDARRFEQTGPDRFVARGELELRGVKRPLSLPFRLKIDGDTARVSGVTSLDRTAFGVGQGEWTSTDQVPAKVAVRINLTARRK